MQYVPLLLLIAVLTLTACGAAPGSGSPGEATTPGSTSQASTPDSSPTAAASATSATPSAAAEPAPSTTAGADLTATRLAVRTTLPAATRLPQAETPAGAPITGEAPREFVDKVIDDLASRNSIDRAAITVISDEAVEWKDGSLGCPQPGMVYPQVIISGYRIILGIGDGRYDYHLSDTGRFVLCEGRQRP